MEAVTDFLFLGSKITADGDCSHEIRWLLLGKKAMTNPDSMLKSRNITSPTKVHLVKAMVFPVVMYRFELDHKEGWVLKNCDFELWCWKRLWCWEGLGARGEGDNRGWDGWMASLTRWTWVWVNSGNWWWTGRPGMLRFMGSQRVGHDWSNAAAACVIFPFISIPQSSHLRLLTGIVLNR